MTPKTESESPPRPETMEVSLPVSLDLKRERPPKEDIQNKLNKFCSVCQVRQSDRETCQTVITLTFLLSGELRE